MYLAEILNPFSVNKYNNCNPFNCNFSRLETINSHGLASNPKLFYCSSIEKELLSHQSWKDPLDEWICLETSLHRLDGKNHLSSSALSQLATTLLYRTSLFPLG
ncbi:hypothetical protein CEXT_530601 [Caerostris extrusa]|uniref:Uncharacterized protein n=1 Tax=Caerostris extrusa TaxID=172846 RepID=A0AAV4PCZ5_CAEEX|nr:hypothetical protein CEXT_530601 [Caerostris extrusa]